MFMRLGTVTVVALTTFALLPAAAPAQARLEIGPLFGYYSPMSSFQPAPYYTTRLPNSPGDLAAAALGGQGRIWLTPRWGLELQVAWASSSFGGAFTPGGPVPNTPARVFTASVQGLYSPAAAFHNARFWLSAGAGLVRHGGTAYARYNAPVQLATVVGLGSAIPLSGRLNANFGLTTLLYSIDVSDSTGTSLEHGFQVDPLLHAGLSWAWR